MDVKEWYQITKDFGAGATFILVGVVVWLKNQLEKERTYTRDLEERTLVVLSKISDVVKDNTTAEQLSTVDLSNSIGGLKIAVGELRSDVNKLYTLIQDHMLKTKRA